MTQTSEMTEAFDEAFADPHAAATEILREFERDDRPDQPVDPFELYNTALLEVDGAIGELRAELAELKRKPPRERRTGAAARVNPDDIRVFHWVLVGSLLLPMFTFTASFAFQRAFGAYTPLEPIWWWVIPVILELPLVVLTPMILVFRRRHESVVGPWLLMGFLTAAASAINFQHAVAEQGLDSATDWLGACFIASWPILTLVTFKFFTRLAVKPEPKTPEPATAGRKTSPNRKGTKK